MRSTSAVRRILSAVVLAAFGVLGVGGVAAVPAAAQDSEAIAEVVAQGLDNPRGMAFGPEARSTSPRPEGAATGAWARVRGRSATGPTGAIYVSNFGVFPGQGQVVRIQ